MKKKVIKFVGLALFIGAMVFNLQYNVEGNKFSNLILKDFMALTASAEEIDPECPNGCVEGDFEGCYCYEFYWYLDEYEWP